jgi:hypothetical protein
MKPANPRSSLSINPALGSATTLTGAGAIALLATWPELSPTRRRDLASCLRSVARAAGMPPDVMTLAPAALRQTLFPRLAAGAGLKSARQSNVLSGLRAVLRRAGVIDDLELQLSDSWERLLALLDSRRRAALSTFAGYCSHRQISPDLLNDATLSAFEHWLTDRTITRLPRKRTGEVRSAWNKAASEASEWPSFRFAKLRQQGQYALPLSDFPESFQADLEVFGRRLAAGPLDMPVDIDIDEDGSMARQPKQPLRPSSVALRKDHAR